MKKKILCCLPVLAAAVLVSCTTESPVYADREFDPALIETTFIVSDFNVTNELSKATVTDKGVQTWSEGDEVYYFSDAASKKMEKVEFTSAGRTPTVLIPHNNGSQFVAAYYPGEAVADPAIKDYTLKNFTCPGVNPVQSGKICCPSVAYAAIDDGTRYMNLTLKNICSALQFELPEENNIDKVVLVVNEKAAGNEINGAFKMDLTAATLAPVFTATYDGKDGSQYESTVNTGKKSGTFYFNVLPCTLEKGFTLKLCSGDNVSSVKYDAVASFTPGRIHNIGNPTIVPPEPETFTFTTIELAAANGWTASGSDAFVASAEYKDISFTVPDNPGGSQNGNVPYDDYRGWRFYMARNSGTLIISSKSGRNIKTVKLTYANKNGGVIMCGDVQLDTDVAVTFTDISSTRTFICVSTTGGAGQYTLNAFEITVQ